MGELIDFTLLSNYYELHRYLLMIKPVFLMNL